MERVRVFKNNTSKAIRIPKSIQALSNADEVDLIPVGNSIIVVPAGQGWASWFDKAKGVTDDFMQSREQPADQEREPLE